MSRLKNNDNNESSVSTSENEESSSTNRNKDLLKKFISEETKLVKGKFRNLETPGASQKITVRKYPPPVPMFEMVMEDGKQYEIPLYVARFINGVDATAEGNGKKIHTCAFPTHGFKFDNSGNIPRSQEDAGIPVPIIAPAKWNRRYSFESLEFDTGE
jgi:hypothetical protein